MITCDRCKCEVCELVECVEVDVSDEDITEYKPEAKIYRYCLKCWDEMITFLVGEGMLF